jgi:hypothetical protein
VVLFSSQFIFTIGATHSGVGIQHKSSSVKVYQSSQCPSEFVSFRSESNFSHIGQNKKECEVFTHTLQSISVGQLASHINVCRFPIFGVSQLESRMLSLLELNFCRNFNCFSNNPAMLLLQKAFLPSVS